MENIKIPYGVIYKFISDESIMHRQFTCSVLQFPGRGIRIILRQVSIDQG